MYAVNVGKFSVAASSQTNESFNNVMAAHKNHCLSTSGACDFRAADAVCVWNDGEKSIANFRSQADLQSEPFTVRYADGTDRKRLKRKIADSTVIKKKRSFIFKNWKRSCCRESFS